MKVAVDQHKKHHTSSATYTEAAYSQQSPYPLLFNLTIVVLMRVVIVSHAQTRDIALWMKQGGAASECVLRKLVFALWRMNGKHSARASL